MYIFTDGSTINNGKKYAIGGIGIYCPSQTINNVEYPEYKLNYSLGGNSTIKVTNQISELIAAIVAIEHAIKIAKGDTIYVYTDSSYVINCATNWCNSWINNNWKKSNGKIIDNLWLIYRLVQLTKKYPVFYKHVKAHTKEPENKSDEKYLLWLGNNIVDKLAQESSQCLLNKSNEIKTLNWDAFANLLIKGMTNDIKVGLPFINEISEFYKKLLEQNKVVENIIDI
jgi:ribonuclease HI